MKKIFLILIVCVFTFPLFACGTSQLLKVSKTLSDYEINIIYDNDNKTLTNTQTVDYVNNSDAILTKVCFHLYPTAFEEGAINKPVSELNMAKAYPNGNSYANINITRTKLNGQDISPLYEGEDDDILVVQLTERLLPTQKTSIYFEYSVVLPNVLHRFGYGSNTINLANFYPVACVYENGDWDTSPYHSNGDPFYSDMANYEVNITYPSALTLASTGNQKTNASAENKSTSITANAVRDFACVLSDKFEVASKKEKNITYSYYYFDDETPNTALQCAIDSIQTFSSLFVDYPYDTYSIVKADFVHGGMEYPNLVYISSDITNYDDYLNVIVHETAHQWWYNLVGNNEYKNPWQDESLTEFCTMLFYDYNNNYTMTRKEMTGAAYDNYLFFISIYKDILGSVDTRMNKAVNEYNTDPEYTYMVYVKGVLMYDSLYQLIGKTCFLKALKTYAQTYCYQNTTPEHLIACFEKSANTDLEGFINAWLDGKVIIN